MRTLTTCRIAPGQSPDATITRRSSMAARVVLLIGTAAVAVLGSGHLASHLGPTAAPGHAVVAGDMGPTAPTPTDTGTPSA